MNVPIQTGYKYPPLSLQNKQTNKQTSKKTTSHAINHIQGEGQGQGPGLREGGTYTPLPPQKTPSDISSSKAISATPLFLFTPGHAINQIARSKRHKIPNHQEK